VSCRCELVFSVGAALAFLKRHPVAVRSAAPSAGDVIVVRLMALDGDEPGGGQLLEPPLNGSDGHTEPCRETSL
jgi:hypothetical protein